MSLNKDKYIKKRWDDATALQIRAFVGFNVTKKGKHNFGCVCLNKRYYFCLILFDMCMCVCIWLFVCLCDIFSFRFLDCISVHVFVTCKHDFDVRINTKTYTPTIFWLCLLGIWKCVLVRSYAFPDDPQSPTVSMASTLPTMLRQKPCWSLKCVDLALSLLSHQH